MPLTEPISQFFYSHRLKLHFWDWRDNGKPNLIFVHGGGDHARSWDKIAEAFINDFRILAPDLRGHGDSNWACGATYSIAEFVLDLATLIDIVGRHPVYLIGHSLGGAVALQYTGVYPEQVKKLVVIEGVGIPADSLPPPPAYQRLKNWIDATRECEKRRPHRYSSLEEAYARMHKANPYLTDEIARHLTLFGSNWNADGTLTWKFDNYVHAKSPYGFDMTESQEIWSQISCPVLLFRGSDSWTQDPEKAGWTRAFRDYRLITVPKAGHWLHHDQPDIFLAETRNFLAG
jgi:pimeloyl-ACP methyl ester carboxylesterase